jgi:hypothetical protein
MARRNMLMAPLRSDEVKACDGNSSARPELPPVCKLNGDVDEGVGVLCTAVYAAEETIWRSRAKLGVPFPVAGSHPDVALKPCVPHPAREQTW